MFNIIKRKATLYFQRRVPVRLKPFESREKIRVSLNTSCPQEAFRLAGIENLKLMAYWDKLVATGDKSGHRNYKHAAERAEILGFEYISQNDLADGNLEELVRRVLFVNQNLNQMTGEAILGNIPVPEILLSDLLPKFWDIRKEVQLDKSELQYKKWQNPRILAINNLVDVVGNKPVHKLCNADLQKFRDWWISRIANESLSKRTANASFVYIKNIICTVCKNQKIKIDKAELFDDFFLKNQGKTRLPFTTDHINNVLLNPENLKSMSDHFRKMIWVFAETGIHFDEQVAIRPENIFLNDEIPHVVVMSHEKDKLKTIHRERTMPLVGYALDAFKAYPNGFSELIKNTDSASTAVGKYLRRHNLLPSDRHTLYSLRHSFQDRLTEAECNDRIQTDLMGHSFEAKRRTKYGAGGTLKKKHQWLKKIQLKPE